MRVIGGTDHEDACRELEVRFGRPAMPARYVCGLTPIDREHALVIAQHRVLLSAIGGPDRHLPAIEFARYVTMLHAHYRSEEALQREVGFPDLIEHARAHRGFLEALAPMLAELQKDGPMPTLTSWMREGSPLWLGVHIKNDLAIARWCREEGVKLEADDPARVWRAGVPDMTVPPSLEAARFPATRRRG